MIDPIEYWLKELRWCWKLRRHAQAHGLLLAKIHNAYVRHCIRMAREAQRQKVLRLIAAEP